MADASLAAAPLVVDLASLQSQINNLTNNVSALQSLNVDQSQNMDDFYLTIMGALVFFMHPGFACLEAGSVRSSNATNLFMINTMILMVSVIGYWIIGFTFAFGPVGNTIFGWGWITSGGMPETLASFWFFQFTFAATSATFASGALAERCKLIGYVIFVFFYTAFIYPWSSHWAWGNGWLYNGDGYIGYQDFAGSGVVHTVGGTAALVGAIILGPRTGRFTRINGVEQPNPFGGHSTPLVTFGAMALFYGFLGFNGGSQLHISKPTDGPAVGLAFMNTCIAGAAGLISITFLRKLETKKWSLLACVNGGLAGMVSICAGANSSYQWGAFCTGVVGGLCYHFTSKLMAKLHVDDPVDTVGVHLVSGTWGVIAQPIFKRNGILTTWSRLAFKGLAWNLLGCAALFLWSLVCSGSLFLILRLLGLLRLPAELEAGQDEDVHGEPAYPVKQNPHLTTASGFGLTKPAAAMNGGQYRPDVINLNDVRGGLPLSQGDMSDYPSQLQQRRGFGGGGGGEVLDPEHGSARYGDTAAPPPNTSETTPRMNSDRYRM